MTAADLIQQIRIEVGDNITPSAGLPASHFARFEKVKGLINGSNKTYAVAHYPIIADGMGAGVDVIATDQNAAVLAITSVNRNQGSFVLTTAVSSGKVIASYYAMFATDTEWLAYLNAGLRYCSQPSVAATSSVLTAPDGLLAGITEYSKSKYYEKLAQQTAPFFSFSAGGKDVDKTSVPKNWVELMKAAAAMAEKLRDDFYNPRQGRAKAPVLMIGTPRQRNQPYTPTR